MERKTLGKKGENHAAVYLKDRGYRIIERNIYIGGGEIDIVALKRGLVIFVEVRTSRNDQFISLEDTLDERKIEALERSCDEYLAKHDSYREYRIDLIAIIMRIKGKFALRHIRGIV